MIALLGGKVYTPTNQFDPGTILVNNGRIVDVGDLERTDIPEGSQRIDAQNKILVPGFIDVHTHGLMGNDVMGSNLTKAIPHYPRFGVTSFMATTLTLPQDEVLQALTNMAQVLDSQPKGANCLGIHLEGPHLSADKPGMATADWFYPLTMEDFGIFQKTAKGYIRMITFAPELNNAMQVIPYLLEEGVTPVIGHSNATFDEVTEAVRLGLNHATHTYNAMRALNHREPGTVGAVMFYDQIYAELIGDGIHIHPAAMEILIRTKGLERTVIISDSSPYSGMPEGEYEWEHKPLFVKDGICRLMDGTIAGAHAQLDSGLRNLVYKLNMPLEKALIPLTMTPAASVNLKSKGQIAKNYDADIVVLNKELYPVMSIVGGEVVWKE